MTANELRIHIESNIEDFLKTPITINEFTAYSPETTESAVFYPFQTIISFNYEEDSLIDCWERANNICESFKHKNLNGLITKTQIKKFGAKQMDNTCIVHLTLHIAGICGEN